MLPHPLRLLIANSTLRNGWLKSIRRPGIFGTPKKGCSGMLRAQLDCFSQKVVQDYYGSLAQYGHLGPRLPLTCCFTLCRLWSEVHLAKEVCHVSIRAAGWKRRGGEGAFWRRGRPFPILKVPYIPSPRIPLTRTYSHNHIKPQGRLGGV